MSIVVGSQILPPPKATLRVLGSIVGSLQSYLSLVVTLQNLVALIRHTMLLAYVGVPKIWGRFLQLRDHVRPKTCLSVDKFLCQIWSFEVKRVA